MKEFKVEQWFCHKWVAGVFHSNEHFGAAVKCTELVAGVGPIEFVVPIEQGDYVVTDLSTGSRQVLNKDASVGLSG
jgi:hypothetical protein